MQVQSKVISEGFNSELQWSFPSTRYQGSKRRILPWIYEHLRSLKFNSALDLFGGTGVVSYLMKRMQKSVTYNDYLKFNFLIGLALIENSDVTLDSQDLKLLLQESKNPRRFIQRIFDDFYYTKQENRWLDHTINNILRLSEVYTGELLRYKKCLAFYALFQSCMAKRPFNLFHRRNLYLRFNDVSRTFGNKTTWDTSFEELFAKFIGEINSLVFSNGKTNKAVNMNAFDIADPYDLVYIDPPYFSASRAPSESDYRQLYHFLEGLANYETWGSMIDYDTYNYRLKKHSFVWRRADLKDRFEELFRRFNKSIIVLSYKSPGVPSLSTLCRLMKRYKRSVEVFRRKHWYALNKNNGKAQSNIELIVIGKG